MTPATGQPPGRGLAVLLLVGALTALGPLSIDAYLPALPRIADELNSTPSMTQLTVTTCLAGLAVGQLLAGPLSDAWGRRKPLLLGLAVYTATSFLCAVAPYLWALVVLRGLQGLGGAFVLVIAYAFVRDRYAGQAAARYFSRLLFVSALAPVIAPVMGAQILRFAGWREIFLALAVLSAALLVACLRGLPESLPPDRRRPGGLRAAGSSYLSLLADRHLVGYSLTNAFVFAAMFVYIAGSPFVLQNLHGLSPQLYSLAFAVNALGLIAAMQASALLLRRVDARLLLGGGVFGSTAGGLALLTFVATDAGLWPILAAFFAIVASVGLVLPNAPALALEEHGARAGAAAALLGFTQFLFGGLAAPLAGGTHSAMPLALATVGFGVAASITYLVLIRPTIPHPVAARRT